MVRAPTGQMSGSLAVPTERHPRGSEGWRIDGRKRRVSELLPDDSLRLRDDAFAGTAIQAALDGSRSAVLVVQDFCGDRVNRAQQERNNANLQSFLDAMAPSAGILRPGVLLGPFATGPNEHLPPQIDLLVGKMRCKIPEFAAIQERLPCS